MTRINSHQVIQMVGDDRVVFVEDRTGEELVLPLAQVADIIHSLEEDVSNLSARQSFGFHAGDNDNPVGPFIDFFWSEFPAVRDTIDYFIQCSLLTPEQQQESIQIHSAEPGESTEDFFRRMGLVD